MPLTRRKSASSKVGSWQRRISSYALAPLPALKQMLTAASTWQACKVFYIVPVLADLLIQKIIEHLENHVELKRILTSLQAPLVRWSEKLLKITDCLDGELRLPGSSD